jgi:hypothetical protein
MTTLFWVMSLISLVACGLLWGIDVNNSNKENKSIMSLTAGYSILFVALVLASWFASRIPEYVIYGGAALAGAYFGRYLIRKVANRKI